jgi:hypothetical protein
MIRQLVTRTRKKNILEFGVRIWFANLLAWWLIFISTPFFPSILDLGVLIVTVLQKDVKENSPTFLGEDGAFVAVSTYRTVRTLTAERSGITKWGWAPFLGAVGNIPINMHNIPMSVI